MWLVASSARGRFANSSKRNCTFEGHDVAPFDGRTRAIVNDREEPMADLKTRHNDIVEEYQMGKSRYTEAEFTVILVRSAPDGPRMIGGE